MPAQPTMGASSGPARRIRATTLNCDFLRSVMIPSPPRWGVILVLDTISLPSAASNVQCLSVTPPCG